jgi:DNA polymerase-3 subunit beta
MIAKPRRKGVFHKFTAPTTSTTIFFKRLHYHYADGPRVGDAFKRSLNKPMQLTIQKRALSEAISQVSKVVPTKHPNSIFTGIKMDVQFDHITLTASNGEISIQTTILAETDSEIIARVEEAGRIVFPAKFFVEIVKKLPGTELEIEISNQNVIFIRSGSSDIQISGLDPDDYPSLPNITEQATFSIKRETLKQMIRKTIFAVSQNEQMPIFTGILFQLQHQELKLTATDRIRLALINQPVEASAELNLPKFVLPAKALSILSNLLTDDESPVQIAVDRNQVLFAFDHLLFYSKLLDGNFPDTTKIIPSSSETELVFNTQELKSAMERANIMSREEKQNIVRLNTLEDFTVEITSSSSDIGRVHEQLLPEDGKGKPILAAFNSKYMIDTLHAIDDEFVYIGFNGPLSPILIQPRTEKGARYIILPYRIN